MNDFTEPIVRALIVAAVLGGVAWGWRKREPLKSWLAGNEARAKQAKELLAAAEVENLREQVLHVARTLGTELPEKATGSRPTIVRFSDGQKSAYFTDYSAYQAAMQSRTVDPTRTFHVRELPVPVSQWGRTRLEEWLADHTI